MKKNDNFKNKYGTLCKGYENGGMKDVDITFRIVSLNCSWIKRLYDNNIHDCKIIPLHIITNKFDYFIPTYT